MPTWVTRQLQQRHGRKPVPVVCSHCGLAQPSLETFPAHNILGVGALIWLMSGRGKIGATGLSCPRCGQPMTLARERANRWRRKSG